MKEIPLAKGKVAIVDDDVYEYLSQWNWTTHCSENKRWYAARNEGYRFHRNILMHRVIMNAPNGVDVDHWDGDGLNNQKYNLRFCTPIQNARNRRCRSDSTVGLKGVGHKDTKKKKRYFARITFEGKDMFLGIFNTPEEAARAYDEKAKELFGDFARTNF